MKKKITHKYRFIEVFLLFGFGFLSSLILVLGFNVYHKIDHNLLEEELGINNLVFADGTNEQEVKKFLKTVDPKYTQGLSYIIVIPNPIFSVLVSSGSEELYRGEAHGRFLKEERSIIFSDDGDFEDTFYHEVGHYIHLILFTDEERKEWEKLMNMSIDYKKVSQFKSENNLNQQESYKLDEYVQASYEHDIGEAFAVYFSLYILNESEIPSPELWGYFNDLPLKWEKGNCSIPTQTTIEEVQNA